MALALRGRGASGSIGVGWNRREEASGTGVSGGRSPVVSADTEARLE